MRREIKSIVILSILLLNLSTVLGGCGSQPNNNPVINQKPQLIQATTNGQQYIISEGTNILYIINLRGSPREMGQAYGELMGKEIGENLYGLLDHLEDGALDFLTGYLPKFLAKGLSKGGRSLLNGLLDLNYDLSRIYTPKRYKEQMKGMAKGSRVSYRMIRRLNLFPELIRAACTVVGAWGKATADGRVLQLRALDWDAKAPITKYPTAVVYHSTEPGSQVFANIGFAGLIGTLSAQSAAGIGIAEKVWIPKKTEGAHYSYLGQPWAYVLRDLAQFETDIQGAINTLNKTHRTMRIHIGIGSAKDNSFRGVQYAHNQVQVFDDSNYVYTEAHPQLDGVMFFDKHVQPSGDACVGTILKAAYGNINVETLFRNVVGMHSTGDAHWAVYDLAKNECYMAFAEYRTAVPAYSRAPIFVDFKPFFQSTGKIVREYNN